ncbi:hypothetical protein WA588_003154 [Blastocystis sp. NMH]
MRLKRPLEWIVLFPALLFGRHLLPLLVFFVSLFIDVRIGLYMGLCCVVTVLFTEPLKYLFGRARPAEDTISTRVVPLRKDVSNPAFPSGDSAQAAVISGVVYSLSSNPLALLIPLPTMFARVYFGAHWIGDTLGGYAIGISMGMYVVPHLVKWLIRIVGGDTDFL